MFVVCVDCLFPSFFFFVSSFCLFTVYSFLHTAPFIFPINQLQLKSLVCVMFGTLLQETICKTQAILRVGALPRLLALLGSPQSVIRKEACFTISNIMTGTRNQIAAAVIDWNIIPPLIHLLSSAEDNVGKEVACAIKNVTSRGSMEQVRDLVQQVYLSSCLYSH